MGNTIFFVVFFLSFPCHRIHNDGGISGIQFHKDKKGFRQLLPHLFSNLHFGLSALDRVIAFSWGGSSLGW